MQENWLKIMQKTSSLCETYCKCPRLPGTSGANSCSALFWLPRLHKKSDGDKLKIEVVHFDDMKKFLDENIFI